MKKIHPNSSRLICLLLVIFTKRYLKFLCTTTDDHQKWLKAFIYNKNREGAWAYCPLREAPGILTCPLWESISISVFFAISLSVLCAGLWGHSVRKAECMHVWYSFLSTSMHSQPSGSCYILHIPHSNSTHSIHIRIWQHILWSYLKVI